MNPFRPTAGATPPELIGREGTLDEYGLQIGSGAPGLLTTSTQPSSAMSNALTPAPSMAPASASAMTWSSTRRTRQEDTRS